MKMELKEDLIMQCINNKNRLINAIKEQPRISLYKKDDVFFRKRMRKGQYGL